MAQQAQHYLQDEACDDNWTRKEAEIVHILCSRSMSEVRFSESEDEAYEEDMEATGPWRD